MCSEFMEASTENTASGWEHYEYFSGTEAVKIQGKMPIGYVE